MPKILKIFPTYSRLIALIHTISFFIILHKTFQCVVIVKYFKFMKKSDVI